MTNTIKAQSTTEEITVYDSFVFRRENYEALRELPDEAADRVLMAVLEWAFNGIEPKLTGIERATFTLIRCSIENDDENRFMKRKIQRKTK